jgi:hypothetical protein
MDVGMVTAICTGVAAIIAAASPVVIELLRQRSKRWAEKAQRNPPGDERSPGARASVARLGPPGSDLRLHRVVRSASTVHRTEIGQVFHWNSHLHSLVIAPSWARICVPDTGPLNDVLQSDLFG